MLRSAYYLHRPKFASDVSCSSDRRMVRFWIGEVPEGVGVVHA